ncbi:type II and III secretion system protein family protein [Pseudahrensia aquimaris]|uniref:Type II and III secretion system protein family protein n=1 Tax=Pseudahrensia aquimaris TaxID=744461 RepID=A0ABW3FEW5_9HYPH
MRSVARSGLSLAAAVSLALSSVFSQGIVLPQQASAQESPRNYIKLEVADSRKTQAVRLGLNKSIVIDLPADAHDILVANPEVADAVTRTSRRIYLFGKEIGQTNIFIFDGRGKQIAALELSIERDIAMLEETIHRLIPNSNVKAEMINDNLVLTGYVATPQDSASAMRIARVFVEGRETDDDSGAAGSGQLVVGDTSSNDEEKPDPIINMLRVDGEDQVHLKVVIAEIQRSVVKQLGIEPNIFNASNGIGEGTDGLGFQILGGQASTLETAGVAGGRFLASDSLGTFGATYRALERTGVMRTLAEPSLTAISGEKAHFRVGGSYWTPKEIKGDGGIEFESLDYGIALSFVPVVLTQGRISLKLRTEVSEPTAQGTYALTSRASLFTTRKRLADTTVELPSGGSMVIAGLVQDNIRQAINGQPWLKDIPFFGTLFRSREFVRNESEVVIIVTPYLVKPTARRNLTTPDKNFQPASDSTGYLLGRINRVYGTKQGKLPKGRYTGSVGFIFK